MKYFPQVMILCGLCTIMASSTASSQKVSDLKGTVAAPSRANFTFKVVRLNETEMSQFSFGKVKNPGLVVVMDRNNRFFLLRPISLPGPDVPGKTGESISIELKTDNNGGPAGFTIPAPLIIGSVVQSQWVKNRLKVTDSQFDYTLLEWPTSDQELDMTFTQEHITYFSHVPKPLGRALMNMLQPIANFQTMRTYGAIGLHYRSASSTGNVKYTPVFSQAERKELLQIARLALECEREAFRLSLEKDVNRPDKNNIAIQEKIDLRNRTIAKCLNRILIKLNQNLEDCVAGSGDNEGNVVEPITRGLFQSIPLAPYELWASDRYKEMTGSDEAKHKSLRGLNRMLLERLYIYSFMHAPSHPDGDMTDNPPGTNLTVPSFIEENFIKKMTIQYDRGN